LTKRGLFVTVPPSTAEIGAAVTNQGGTTVRELTARSRATLGRTGLAAACLAGVVALLLALVVQGASAISSAATAVSVPLRINAGGPAYTDPSGNVWQADKAYTAGSWGYDTSYGTTSTTHTIANTTTPTLYQTANTFNNNTGYKIDIANGSYSVTLKMLEDWANAAGQRKFDVTIEGAKVLTAFDIFASCGAYSACDRAFTVTVSDGQLDIQLTMNGGANYGTVSAIQVAGTGGGDTTPPSAPANLTSPSHTSSSVSLSWSASTDNVGVTGYRVYRNGTQVGTPTSTSYTDSGLTASTAYTYTVKAADAAGNLSAASNSLSVTTSASTDTTAPSAPGNLNSPSHTSSSVALSWTASTDNVGVTGYQVFRGTTLVTTATGTSYTDTGLAASTTYSYTVKARDAAGNVSAASNALSVTTSAASTDTTPPSTPTGLASSNVTSASVTLSWSASTDNVGVSGYDVLRGGAVIGSSAGTTFTDGGVSPSTTYSYTVRAKDAAGNVSAQSSALSVTTPAGTPPKITTPTGLAVAGTTDRSVTLTWSASASNAGTGKVVAYYVRNTSGTIVATSMGTKVTVSSLTPSTAYTFVVQGYDQDGNTSASSSSVSATTGGAIAIPYQHVAYYDQWSIYGNAFYPRNTDVNGMAGKLTTMIYDFENIDPVNLTCFETIKASDSTNESNPNAGDGAGDAFADYQKSYTGDISVDGSADSWSAPLKGTFNQLRELKAKYPKLRIVVSLGGWTYSKYFSDVAATAAARTKYVSSCIDMFLKGNLPTGISGDAAGGPGSAAGIFDGFDIDWEYPGVVGHTGNHVSSSDGANYTLLMQEFRRQLDSYGSTVGKKFLLTAAVPSGQDKIAQFQPSQLATPMDWLDVMSYDMHGAWETTTNHQSPLHNSPSDPSTPLKYNIDTALNAWTSAGFPASKLMLGIPFYARGWTGVSAGSNFGLYQPASGPSAAFGTSAQAGVAYWKELVAAGLTSSFHSDATAGAYWIYSGNSFYTLDPPASISAKDAYIKSKGLGGAMMFSLLDDDPSATLFNAVVNGL
jgi:chitinase